MKTLLSLFTLFFLSTLCLAQNIELSSFATGLTQPVEITNTGIPNDTRLFVVEQRGIIKIINSDGSVNTTPFLDITGLVGSGGERGLLGVAFAPDYEVSGRFYVNYTDNSSTSVPDTIIARYTVSSNPNIANTTETILLRFQQPFSNHNGGKIAFGPDSFLYIGTGDGGSGGDPGDRAQDVTSFFGKLLRIDVSGTSYSIPNTNPFSSSMNGANDPRPEIYAIGLRNPWKFSFDKNNGDLWIADVGQQLYEEINRVDGSGNAGDNYGWRCFEANSPFNLNGNCPSGGISNTVAPTGAYDHSGGKCSITGGYVYRGSIYSAFMGKYFFADYCSREIGLLSNTVSGWILTLQTPNITRNWSTFGQDINGELYIAGGSSVYKIEDSNLNISNTELIDLKVFPNPTKNHVNIDLTSKFNAVKTVKIINILQQEITTIKNPNKQTIKISTERFSNGLYAIEIVLNDNSRAIKKLIIH